ncbi:hypothetical protein EV697_10683 [Bisgaardia hudsonensis]|uniref:7-cyano-7-deazaguanine synthase in queuosine biosynthesis n=1 Tax=Bisgaardia hudsonensis TaxID=109472 RepID=A0A4R2MWU6_9PAST|nr:hypothetical protein [Bisgaardia hudsonensis]QLB13788.1 hypothetical protein A6A11_09300 [Bisgaardia hudsonensis]TCP11729.1 hypothetical protein EV697_10683 [Bisgaardia hudsonensis]
MSTLLCKFIPDLFKYEISFQTNEKKYNFSAEFIINPPENFVYKPVTVYDGFIFGVIFKAMEVGEDFIVDLPLSIKAVQNINYFIEAWADLCPDKYKRIKFTAKNIVLSSSEHFEKLEAISAFSGGVDSCYTLIRHNERDWGEASFNLKNVLCIQGFDVPTNKTQEYKKLISRISPIYEQFNCNKFEVWTNLKEVSQQDWEMSHGAQIACCFHLLSEHFQLGLLGSSDNYANLTVPWGSSPSTDFLLSGSKLTIVHDGSGATRTKKVERISGNVLATKFLKVCWEKGLEDNCGECEKCSRTKLNFLAVGIKNPECFDGITDVAKMKNLRLRNEVKLSEFYPILKYAKEHGINEKWLYQLRVIILKNKIKNLFRIKFKK